MPRTEVLFFKDAKGKVPVLDWLKNLRKANPHAYAKCRSIIGRLKAMGHELRRPEADFLREGLYELRTRHRNINYRILYFFHGRGVAVLAHAMTKESKIPESELNKVLARKVDFEHTPKAHTYDEEDDDV